jgi:transglutaminase-like putative cysteine protease
VPVLDITHRTEYRYATQVAPGPHRMMLRPRETPDLKLLAFDLSVSPEAAVVWSHDVAGNSVATASFAGTTDALTVESNTRVDLRAPVWPVFDIAASALFYPFRYSDNDLIDLGALARPQYVDATGRLAAWVEGFVMQRPTDTLSLLKDISNGVTARIAYQTRDTEGTQGPLETLDRGWGSCRDFAVLFAEAVRTMGFGARIVSGYLSDPARDQIGSSGAGSTHAWVELFLSGAGWIAFDPTNRAVGSGNLIPVAVGRHISQVAPVAGNFFGRPGDVPSMTVRVSVDPE